MKIFQTLEDRGNAHEIEELGPFRCTNHLAWMGDGYYFWEADVNLGHWWGETVHQGNYIICESKYTLDLEKCWDIYNNFEARQDFENIVNEIKRRNVNSGKPLKARDVIDFLRKSNTLEYESIRFSAHGSIGNTSSFSSKIIVRSRNFGSAYIDLTPAIQLCFFKYNDSKRKGYFIIYPEHYSIDQDFAF